MVYCVCFSLKITDCFFQYALPCLCNQLHEFCYLLIIVSILVYIMSVFFFIFSSIAPLRCTQICRHHFIDKAFL